MKESPQLKKAEANMRPGVISLDGFLGNDPRPLVDILVADEGTVRRMGLTHAGIAEKMGFFLKAGMAGLGEFVDVEPHFEVMVQSVRGKLPCPFGDPGLIPKTNVTVINRSNGKQVTYTEFHIHLVGEHGFYEGHGSPYRLDPRLLQEVLEIESLDL